MLLASDFLYDQSAALFGFSGRLKVNTALTEIQLVNANNASVVLHSVPLADFSGKVDIKGSPQNDTLLLDKNLEQLNLLGSLQFNGGSGIDTATFEGNLNTHGQNLTFTADSISVLANAILSTQKVDATGTIFSDAGSISFVGKTIVLGSGSALLAEVGNSTTAKAGSITVKAQDTPTAAESVIGDILSPVLVTNRLASISATGAKIRGGDVTLSVESETQTRWDDVGEYANEIAGQLFTTLSSISDVAVSLALPLSGQVKIQKATGDVTLTDTEIVSSGSVDISATSSSDASFTTVGVNSKVPIGGSTSPLLISIGYGETLAKANIALDGATKISAQGDVSVVSDVSSSSGVVSRGSGNGVLSNSDAVDYAISLAISLTNEESTVRLAKDSQIITAHGSVNVKANGEADTEAEAQTHLFRDGVAGLAVGVSVDKATITNDVFGTIIAENPQGATAFEFLSSDVVNVAGDTITLENIAADQAIIPWQQLVYRANGNPSIGGLNDGESYYVSEVENVPQGNTFSGTQKIRLAKTLPLKLDSDQVVPTAQHSLSRLLLTEFPSSAVSKDASNNLTIDIASPATSGMDVADLVSGNKVKYLGPNSPVSEKNITANFQRNNSGDRITRTDGGKDWQALGLHVGQTIQFKDAKANDGQYTVKGFSPDGRTLILREANRVTNGPFSTFSLATTPDEPTAVGNLTQGTEYTLEIQGSKVLLKDPNDPTKFVRFSKQGAGVHGFSFTSAKKLFSPKTAVDKENYSIAVPSHGYQTGDLLVYNTDPNSRFQRSIFSFAASKPNEPNLLGTTDLPDAPIDGLENGFYYYVTKVDADHILLSESSVAAKRADSIDLTSTSAGNHAFAVPSDVAGISITAKLKATNSASAGVELSDGEQPWSDVLLSAPTNAESLLVGMTRGQDLIKSLRSAFGSKVPKTAPPRPSNPAPNQPPAKGLPLQDPTESGVPVEVAGTFAINVFQHTVNATVGSQAVLRSGKDINIEAEVEEDIGLGSISEATRNGLDSADASDTGENREDIEISVAFAFGQNRNYARAIIADGATLNAKGGISVSSKVEYPLKIDSADSLFNPAETVKESGLDALAFLLDGTLGASTNLFNSEVSAIGGDPGSNAADKFVLGLGLSVNLFDNESIARIGAANINQDVSFRNVQQKVDVLATTTIQTVDVGHNAAFNLSLPGLLEAGQGAFESGDPKSFFQSIINPFGSSGQSAIGASILISVGTNNTTAEVTDGASIHTGSANSGLTVQADQDVLGIAVAQTGSQASEFGLSPSVTVASIISKTIARIGNVAKITGGDVNVLANDTVNLYGIEGGYVAGNKVGIGAAIGVNLVDRTTLAYLGTDTPNSDAILSTIPTVNVSGAINVKAHEKGNIFTLAFAGAFLTEAKNEPTKNQPQPNPTTPAPVGGITAAVGASVAYNRVSSTVRAFIDDPSIRAETITIDATSEIVVRAIVVGGAVNTAKGSTNIAGAGAFAINDLSIRQIQAFVRDANLEATGGTSVTPAVSITAVDNATIYADGGGVALALALGVTNSVTNVSVGISVAINDIGSNVLSLVDNSTIDASGNLVIDARLSPTIDALTIAGAGSVSSGGSGSVLNIAGAGAGSKNVIHGSAIASIIDTNPINARGIITRNAGNIQITATDTSKITADGGAVALALSLSSSGNFVNLGFAISVGINEVTTNVEASVVGSTVQSDGDLLLTASSDATIDTLTIGGALTNGGSFSGAGSGNTIRNTTKAVIRGVGATNSNPAILAKGAVGVLALDTSLVKADAGGFGIVLNVFSSGGDSLSGSIGIGAAVNDIENQLIATILDTTVTGKDVSVSSTSTAEILAFTIAGAGAVNISDGSAFSFNGAGAGSGNKISNKVEASIQDLIPNNGPTTVKAVSGGVTIASSDKSHIKADAGAVAFALGISQGSSNINLSVGVSIAINDITNTVQSFVSSATVDSVAAVSVSAKSESSIEALTIAGAGSLGLRPGGSSGFGLQFAGAGTGSGNTIDGTTQAYVSSAAIIRSASGKNVRVLAEDISTIKSTAISGSVSAQLDSGGSAAIGAAIAKNVIDSDVLAYVDSATVNSGSEVVVSATSKSVVDAITVAVAVSININPGSGVSLSGSGAGAQSTNTITNTIEASIRNGTSVTTLGSNAVVLTAVDDSKIKADSGGGSLAVSAQPSGFSGAFGVSAALSFNTIQNSILAYVDGASTQISSSGDVLISADSKSQMNALSVSVAGAIAIANPASGFSLAMVGAGAQSNNKVENTIAAYIDNRAAVTASRNIVIKATDDSKIKADVPAISFVISIGVGLSTSVTLSENTINNKVDAYIGNSNVTSTTGDIALKAETNGKVESFATAISLNISIGGSGQGGKTTSEIIGHTEAYVKPGALLTAREGDVSIDAIATAYTNAEAKGGGLGLLSITALLAESTISADTKAFINGPSTVNAGGLEINAHAFGKDGVSARTALSKVVAGTVAIVGGGGGNATSLVSGPVEAFIGNFTAVNINRRPNSTGAIEVMADSKSKAAADSPGGSGGGITVTALLANATTSGATKAYVGRAGLLANSISILSNADNWADAHLLVANVGIAGGSGGKATAKQLADTEASIGDAASVQILGAGNVNLKADSTSKSISKAEGGGGGILNVTAFEAVATIGEKVNDVVDAATTTAFVAGAQLNGAGNLTVDANSTNTVTSDLLSVSIGGAGISSTASDGSIYSDTLAYLGLKADTGFVANLNVLGTTQVHATSTSNLSAKEIAGGGGGLAIASAVANGTIKGTTAAYIGDATNITSGAIDVKAEILGMIGTADMLAATGGLISIGSTKATLVVEPQSLAYFGRGVLVQSGNVSIWAIGRAEGDVLSNSSGGGVLQIGVARAESTVNPTVDAYIGAGSNVNASGNVSVKSELISSPTPAPSDVIKSSDINSDTVDFGIRVASGDELTYKAPNSAPSFGLEDGRTYNVIAIDPGKKLQFGDEFDSQRVDPLTDQIIFSTPHAFKPGDAVRYDAKGSLSIVEPWQTTLPSSSPLFVAPTAVLYVRGVYTDPSNLDSLDKTRIRLARTFNEAMTSEGAMLQSFNASTNLEPAGDSITIIGHGFVEGQAVTYRSEASSQFMTEGVDTKLVDRTVTIANSASQTIKDVERDSNQVVKHVDNNRIFVPGHKFASGDAVTYSSDSPIGGLVSGSTYYVIKLDANQIQLAKSYFESVGRDFDDSGNADPADDILAVAVTPMQLNPTGNQQQIHRLSRDIHGLSDGQTYYVKSASQHVFQLASTRGGVAIDLGISESIPITRRDGILSNTIDVTTRGGNYRLGTLGIDLRAGEKSQSLRIDLTGQPAGGDHHLLGAVAAAAPGDGKSSSDAVGGSGGAIDIAVPSAVLNTIPSVKAHIDATQVNAKGNVAVISMSKSSVSSKGDTGGGGIASIGEAHADTLMTSAPTEASVAAGTVIVAGGNVVIQSDSDHSTAAVAKSVGGGAFAVKVAETTSRLNADTRSTIGEGARVTSGGLVSVLSTSNFNGTSSAETYAVALGAFADSDNTNDDRGVDIDSPATVKIGKGAVIEAQEVDLNATIGRADATARATATAYSPVFFGVATAFADASANVDATAQVLIEANAAGASNQTRIVGKQGVDIQAHHPASPNIARNDYSLAVAIIPPQGSRKLGATNVTSKVVGDAEAVVLAGPRAPTTTLVSRPSISRLALFVDADGSTTWNSDVNIFGVSPELIVDAAGQIIKQVNIGATVDTATNRVVVTGVTNSGPGQVLFEGSGSVAGNQATFTFQGNLPGINIKTGKHTLVVGNLSAVNQSSSGIEPKVTLDVPRVSLEFDVAQTFIATTIDIQNLDPAPAQGIGILLTGLIDNPIGITKLSTSGGGIYSQNFRQRQGVVRTNRLEIDAFTDAGGTTPNGKDRIPVDIVESTGRPARLLVSARNDINVGLQALQRGAPSSGFVSTSDSLDSVFDAFNRADIMLLGGLLQRTVPSSTNLGIQVFETNRVTEPASAPAPTSPATSPRTTPVTDHFRVSSANSTGLPVSIFGTGNTSIDVTYSLGFVQAGKSINIYKDDPVSSRVNIVSQTNLPFVTQGAIDAKTNGFIRLSEAAGDMAIGQVQSTDGDVSLTALLGSLYDFGRDTQPDAIGVNVTLIAKGQGNGQLNLGEIGDASKSFDIDSSSPRSGLVNANAYGEIFLTEVDDLDGLDDDYLNVGLIKSEQRSVTLVTQHGGIFDAANDFAADVIGNDITLLAKVAAVGSDGIGQPNNDLEIDTGVQTEPLAIMSRGFLIAHSNGAIRITETANELFVYDVAGTDSSTRPDVYLTVRDDATRNNNLKLGRIVSLFGNEFTESGSILARNLVLTAGDDVFVAVGDTINAQQMVTIATDPAAGDPDAFGGTIKIENRIVAQSIQLIGGDDIDVFDTVGQNLPAGNSVKVFGGLPAYPTYPGDKLIATSDFSHPPLDQASVEQGKGILTSGSFSPLDFVNIEIIDRRPGVFPILLVPPPTCSSESPIVFSEATGNRFRILAYDDINTTNVSLRLSVFTGTTTSPIANGTLAFNDPALPATGNGSPSNPLIILRGATSVDAALRSGFRYTPLPGFTGKVTLLVRYGDEIGLDDRFYSIDVGCAINNPPINILPSPISTNATTIVMSQANNNKLAVADPDARNAANFTVTLSVPVGSLNLASQNGITLSGTSTALVLTGTLSNINVALASGLILTAPVEFLGLIPLTITSNDAGNTGSGGAKSDTDILSIRIVDQNTANDPPINFLPPPIVTDQVPVVLSLANGNRLFVTDLDDNNADNFSVTLSVPQGTLRLDNPIGVTAIGNGSSSRPLTITGTRTNINTALDAGVRFLPPFDNFLGMTILTIISNDAGNTGEGGPKTDTDTLSITIVDSNPVNNPPINQLPAPVTTISVPVLFSAANGNNLFVTDVDAGSANNFFVSLRVNSGNLVLLNTAGIAAISGNGSTSSPLGLRGTLANINSALANGLQFLPGSTTGTTVLTMISNDNGNTGTGGAKTDTDTLNITIVDSNGPENDAPVNHLPPPVVTSQLPIVFSQVNNNAFFVTDIDAGNGIVEVTLTSANGRLTLLDSNGLVIRGAGTIASPLKLTGQLQQINSALLSGLRFVPFGGFTGQTSIAIVSNDLGNTGSGGPKQDRDVLSITIRDEQVLVNDPPVNHLPPNFTTSVLPVVLSETNGNMIAVTDIDAGEATNFKVTLSVVDGTLFLNNVNGLAIQGNGSLASPLEVVGKLSDIDAALANGLTFVPRGGFLGTTRLTVVSNDRGNSGTGGELVDTDTLSITIVDINPAFNDPPVNRLPAPVTSNQLPLLLSYSNGNNLFVTDIDAGNANNFQVTLSVPIGTLFLVNESGISVAGVGSSATPLVLTGTLENINNALATGLNFLPPVGFLGTTKLTIVSNDRGNSGLGGFLTDTDTLDLTVVDTSPNNNPPVNHLPLPVTTNSVPFVLSSANRNRLYVTDIDAKSDSIFLVTLSLANGRLRLPNATALTVQGNGSANSPLTVVGRLEDINVALANGLLVIPTGGFLGKTTLTIVSNDNGNTGLGGVGIDTDTLDITIVDSNPNNDAPVNHLPPAITTSDTSVVLSVANGNELHVSDIDAGNAGNFAVSLSVTSGSISLVKSIGVTVSGVGTSATPLTLTGTLSSINDALAAGLVYIPAFGVGTASLTILSNDAGNSGLGGPLTDTDTLSITITDPNPAINDAPVNHLPAPFTAQGVQILLSKANRNGLAVSDVDAGDANNFQVQLSSNNGILFLSNSTDLTVTGIGLTDDPLVIIGKLSTINSRLDEGLVFQPASSSTSTISMVSNDRGNTGTGGEKTDSDTVDITVDRLENDPPVNSLPAPVVTSQLVVRLSALNGNSLSVSDIDAGDANDFSVTLKVDVGWLRLASKTGVNGGGDGTPANPLKLMGKLFDINAALNDGLEFLPPGGFVGTANLLMVSNDAGNTGVGGPMSDTDTLKITVRDDNPLLNDPPINHLPQPVVTSQLPVVFSSANGNQLHVTDIDAGNANNFNVTLSVANGMLVLSDPRSVNFAGLGTPSSPISLTGTLTNIDAVLAAGVQFFPNGFLGTTQLTIKSDDRGNTGLGGSLTDTDFLSITIIDADTTNNDPPVNHLPAPIVTNRLPIVLSAANGRPLLVSDIDAGAANDFLVQLHVGTDGTLSLANRQGLSISGVGSLFSPLLLIGSLETINQRLAEGLLYVPTGGFQGNAILTIFSDDRGNTGAGGAKTDTDQLSILVLDSQPENDPPVNVLPPSVTFGQLPAILSGVNFNAIAVTDIDAGFANNFEVSLSVADGRLALIDRRDVTVIGIGTPGAPLKLIGSLLNINARLQTGLQVLPGRLGSTTLTIVSNDNGNTGTGGPKSDTDTLAINFTDSSPLLNDPPVNFLPPDFTTSAVPVVFSESNGNSLAVSDIDAGDATNFSVTLKVPVGELLLFKSSGITVTGNGTGALQLVGTQTDINLVLAKGLQFLPPAPFVGNYVLTMESNDRGNTGLGGPKSATNTLRFTIVDPNPVQNNAPVNHLPSPIVSNQIPLLLSQANGNNLYVTDIDAGSANNFVVRLSVPVGTLSLGPTIGITLSGNGSPSSPLVLTGALLNINNALASGLQFLPPVDFIGKTALTIVSNDNGNTGTGGPLTDTDQLSITINDTRPANTPPVNHLPGSIVTRDAFLPFSTAQGTRIFVTDIDAGNAADFTVSLSVADGQLTLTSINRVVVTGKGTASDPLVMIGSLLDIDAAINGGLIYLPSGFLGTTTLTILSNDKGNSGAGGELTDIDTMTIQVIDPSNINDPPVNHLPAPVITTSTPITFSQVGGNSLFVIDIDAGSINSIRVTFTVGTGTLSLLSNAYVTFTGNGESSTPLELTGTLASINSALASGLKYAAPAGYLGTTTLTMISNDLGNTGLGGPKTDTDSMSITINGTNAGPRVLSVIADSSEWADTFRDYVDGGFTDPSKLGYRISTGTKQLLTLPWVNIDRLHVVFSKDVAGSIDLSDFQLVATPGYIALSNPIEAIPKITRVTYDAARLTATLFLDKAFGAAVADLKIGAFGVSDSALNKLDGEWKDGVTTDGSGNGVPGGDFSFRMFVLPGDSAEETRGSGTRTVNSNDAQKVRDLQNGFALPGFGSIAYDARADLDGSSFINSDDSQFSREQQNAIIFLGSGRFGQNTARPMDTDKDGNVTPLDALVVINALNNRAGGDITISPYVESLDVTGDGDLSPLDALVVINALNRDSGAGGEGEESAIKVEVKLAPTKAQGMFHSIDPTLCQLYEPTLHDQAIRSEWTQGDDAFFAKFGLANSPTTPELAGDNDLQSNENSPINDWMHTLVEDLLRATSKSKNPLRQLGSMKIARGLPN